jgi:DNA-binding transcriptional MerR regulator
MDKSAEAFRTISEVSEVLATPAHVLRFWESKFTQVKPVKRGGGRRYYRPTDIALLGGIRRLLHDDGLTIRGVQKILREKGAKHVAAMAGDGLPALPAEEPRALPPDTGSFVPPSRAVRGDGGDLFDRAVRGVAPEAPMAVDAPTLPLTESGMPVQFPAAAATATGGTADTEFGDNGAAGRRDRQPAANLLRAMDALRARDNRAELTMVYRRLSSLRDRLAGSDDPRAV